MWFHTPIVIQSLLYLYLMFAYVIHGLPESKFDYSSPGLYFFVDSHSRITASFVRLFFTVLVSCGGYLLWSLRRTLAINVFWFSFLVCLMKVNVLLMSPVSMQTFVLDWISVSCWNTSMTSIFKDLEHCHIEQWLSSQAAVCMPWEAEYHIFFFDLSTLVICWAS